jgi:RHS repeat-associated protein
VIEANEALFGDATPAQITYTYDQAGYPNSITYPDGNSIEITPDHQGRISLVTADDTNVASYKYVGSRVAERYNSVPNVTYQPEYDSLGRMTRSYAYKVSSGNPVMDLAYSYDNANDRTQAAFDHIPDCSAGPLEDYDYDTLSRITDANYFVVTDPNLTDYETEVFTMDKLGNRSNVKLRSDSNDAYSVDDLTNRYDSVGDKYYYDYENRIVEITDDGDSTVAEFAYDALGRRVRKVDSVANETTLYYHNSNWQVLAETDANGTTQRWYVYGNYIDEPLMMVAPCLDSTEPGNYYAHTVYYVQDGTYNVRALVSTKGWVISEQTAYDVYGRAVTWATCDVDADGDFDASDRDKLLLSFGKSECDPNYNWRCDFDYSGTVNLSEVFAAVPARYSSTPSNQQSYFTNPYYFTGRRLDVLDDGDLTLQHNRLRHYDYYAARWLSEDPFGYLDGLNLYEYVLSNPIIWVDAYGLCCRNKCTAGKVEFKTMDTVITPYHVRPSWKGAIRGTKAASLGLDVATITEIVMGAAMGLTPAQIAAKIGSTIVNQVVVKIVEKAFHKYIKQIAAKLAESGSWAFLKIKIKRCKKKRCWCLYSTRFDWKKDKKAKYYQCQDGTDILGIYKDEMTAAGQLGACKATFKDKVKEAQATNNPRAIDGLLW